MSGTILGTLILFIPYNNIVLGIIIYLFSDKETTKIYEYTSTMKTERWDLSSVPLWPGTQGHALPCSVAHSPQHWR